MNDKQIHQGGCLCGAVRYRVSGRLTPVWACHCTQCRKTSGSYVQSTNAKNADLEIFDNRGLRWYQSSARAQRGFCQVCGSSLFWQETGSPETSIAAGTLDGPTGLTLEGHIFIADKGDYYGIPSSETQHTSRPPQS